LQYTLASYTAKREIKFLQNLLNPCEFLETSISDDFTDIDVPIGINPDAVRGITELPGGISLLAPPSDDFPLKRHDTDALPTFSDVNDVITINEEIVWGTEVCPLRQVFAVVVKNLAAKVPTIKDIDAVIMVDCNIVWEVKFSRSRAGCPP